MVSLPASIESYLQEAGFSATELLILKRLLEGEALTLRELAAKTGKSTGVLDQATKKLIERQIVTKESINGTMKYAITSLESINKWMEKDMAQRHAVLERKRKDFEAFISTVEHESGRPEMEYFEGLSGIEQAFKKLLEKQEAEWLHFNPALLREEDDPLIEYRVNMFRERRKNKVFMRVLSPDVPLGRRYQSRDVFEYRQTHLVDPDTFPVSFEQYIVGDTVACIDVPAQRASFIRFPDHAEGQKKLFHVLWCQSEKEKDKEVCEVESVEQQKADMETKVLSGLREFFMGRKSIITLMLIAVVSGIITYGLYKSNQSLNFQRMQDQVVAIARTGALQMDVNDLNQLRKQNDYKKPVWRKVEQQLISIKDGNADIMYAYIFRKSDTGDGLEFVADATSLNPFANVDDDPTNDVDMNQDGKIDGSPDGGDYQAWPGQPWPGPDSAYDSFNGSAASDFYEDQWGKVVTGFAPIKNDKGNVVAVLAVDMKATKLDELTRSTFVPVYVFFGLFFLFIFVRMAAFHRSLMREILMHLKQRNVLAIIGLFICVAAAITWGIYLSYQNINTDRLADKALAIATTASLEINGNDLSSLRKEEDMKTSTYQKVFNTLNDIRNLNKDVVYIYIIRPDKDLTKFEWVVDADSNFDIPYMYDFNGDGVINDADQGVYPGLQLDVSSFAEFDNADITKPIKGKRIQSDQWGRFVTSYAPIKNSNGVVVGLLGVDYKAEEIQNITFGTFNPFYAFLSLFVLFLLIRLTTFHGLLLKNAIQLSRQKKFLSVLTITACIALAATIGMHKYTLELMKDEIGERLMSIAATAAPEINASDLESLHFARDMKRPEYQRVYNKLNEIRDRNENIIYIYIMRPTDNPDIWEFVVDGDTNTFLPEYLDVNADGQLNQADEAVPPGTQYDVGYSAPKIRDYGLKQPTYDDDFYSDQWGTFLSANAPIYNNAGNAVAILGLDMDVSDVYDLTKKKFIPLFWFLVIFSFLILLRIVSLVIPFKKKL